jgi:hypothetical protein
LNIYIYGDSSFKQEIHKLLDHANIKFKLGSGYIEYVDSLELLKEAIKSNPEDIYLIDNSKIIDKNSLNAKIKFLKPKDGIEKEFLQEYGIGDLSVDSLDSLVKHINKKIEESGTKEDEVFESKEPSNEEDVLADAYTQSESDTPASPKDDDEGLIDAELSDLLEYDKWEEDEEKNDTQQEKDFLDDDLLSFDEKDLPIDLLSFDEVEDNQSQNATSELDNIDEELATIMNFNDVNQKSDEHIDHDVDNFEELMNFDNIGDLNETIQEPTKEEKPIKTISVNQGATMSNELDELSGLNEKDILAAIEGIDFAAPPVIKASTKPAVNSTPSISSTTQSQNVSLQGFDLNQISQLIFQLLQNKTLDISIKIRD